MEESIEVSLLEVIKNEFGLKNSDIRQYSPLTLAFIGDGIFDLIIRTFVVEQGNAPVNKLHKKVSGFVNASAQTEIFHRIEPFLTEEEVEIYKRGRNAKSFTSAKNATIIEYRIATGLEALMGYLYLMDRTKRAVELVKVGLQFDKS